MSDERLSLDNLGSSATPQDTGENGQQETSFIQPSGSETTPRRQENTYRLTVNHPPAINISECLSEDTKKDCSSCWKTSLRLVAVLVVFLVVLACSAVCKLSLFYLEVKLYTLVNNSTGGNSTLADTTTISPLTTTTSSNDVNSCDPEDPTEETVVIWLALILGIPYVITFLRCVWISLMNWNYEPTPARRHIVLGVIVATSEALSLATLVLRALPTSPSVSLIVVNSVFMFVVLTKLSYFDINGVPSGTQVGDNGVTPAQNGGGVNYVPSGTQAEDNGVTPAQSGVGVNDVPSRSGAGGNGVTIAQSRGDVNDVPSGSGAGGNVVTPAQSRGDVNDVPSGSGAGGNVVTPAQSRGDVNDVPSGSEAGGNVVTPAQSGVGVNGDPSGSGAEDNVVTTAQSVGGVNDVPSGSQAEGNSVTSVQSGGGVNGVRSRRIGDNSENPSRSEGDANVRVVGGAGQSKVKGALFYTLFFFILAGLVVTVALDQYRSTRLDWEIATAVSLVVLAVCWTPKLQEATIINNTSVTDNTGPKQNSTTCWKLGIITNFIKILVLVLCVFFFYPWTKGQNPLDVNWHIVPLCSSESYAVFRAFLANVLCGVFGYLFATLALKMKMQKVGFLLPISLSNVAVIVFLLVGIQWEPICVTLCYNISFVHESYICTQELNQWEPILITCVLVAATFIGLVVQLYDVWQMTTTVMEKQSNLFYTPGYNSVLLDQWLLLSRRKQRKRQQEGSVARVFVCTTMYHESKVEMKQLMDSLWDMAKNQTIDRIEESKIKFESHIFFDDGCKGVQVQDYALQLLSIIDDKTKKNETSLIEDSKCKKWRTPYGLQLQWKLPSVDNADNSGMYLTLHLKDNNKVKNKKRWSQVMYMSYVLDYVRKCPADNEVNALDRKTYILATDADVKFTPESALALLDLARRDPTVGAVCGRTHPLGSGPMVWYQMFDYAVGHWFQKTSNSVLGSVLCCPGCFSVYRAEALRQALEIYSSGASNAMEFLMKDMGEDRWLCTLMVSNGWRLEYTAVSEDSTYCPEEFKEFFNQRRRWGPSTVANQVELLHKYFTCGADMSHDSVSFPFMLYQGLLFISALIGPATCVLIIAGGLESFNSYNGTAAAQTLSITTAVVLSLVSLLYGLICLCTSKDFQVKMAMFLSLCFAVLMILVLVSLIEDIVNEFKTWNEHISEGRSYIPSISTLYFLALVGMYVITGLVHITEFHTLFYGLVYFLSLPTGYILLTLYSVCNLTDRTWGTREGNSSGHSTNRSLKETISDFFATICGRRSNPEPEEQPLLQTEEELGSNGDAQLGSISEDSAGDGNVRRESRVRRTSRETSRSRRISVVEMEGEIVETVGTTDARRWLQSISNDRVFVQYADKFESNGYSNTDFITGMDDKDLRTIEIEQEFHRIRLLAEIRKLPEFQLETAVPSNATDWLKMLNLEEYTEAFQRYGVDTKGDLACLRQTGDLDQVMEHLGITKRGHSKRLKLAIDAMKEPDELEKKKYRVKRILMGRGGSIKDLKEKERRSRTGEEDEEDEEDDGEMEWTFWEELHKAKLDPELAKFSDEDLEENLIGLRNSALAVLLVANVFWITIMMVLSSREALQVLGQNPMGFLSLAVFGLVQAIQFLAMLYHRLLTVMHYLARL